MHRIFPIVALLSGCLAAGELTPFGEDYTYVPSNDTAATVDTATEDTGEQQPPPPQTDFSTWTGARTISYDAYGGCTDEILETGDLIDTGEAIYAQLSSACSACKYFYEVTLSPDEICGWISVADSTYRGLIVGDDWGAIYQLSETDGGHFNSEALSVEADWDGTRLQYAYEAQVYSIDLEIQGTVDFPLTY